MSGRLIFGLGVFIKGISIILNRHLNGKSHDDGVLLVVAVTLP